MQSLLFLQAKARALPPPAHGLIEQAVTVVGSMLLQGQLPEPGADLVASLAHLNSDQLPRHTLSALETVLKDLWGNQHRTSSTAPTTTDAFGM